MTSLTPRINVHRSGRNDRNDRGSAGPAARQTVQHRARGSSPKELSSATASAINGCCLTVIGVDRAKLDFEAGEETLSRTNLGELICRSLVNLERSLAVGDRLGGHYVTGHIERSGDDHGAS